MKIKRIIAVLVLPLTLISCDSSSISVEQFVKYVTTHKIGNSADYWVEMKNALGGWEKTILVFGYYVGDGSECESVIAGLKSINYARDYRCTAAN